ncbi:MAG TPA: glycosyl hydrolase family 17 protein [bacterium]|nr:glycosyl hydrolase family 17 protein [bacterium]HQO33302.1 glycosyl hydrolase family 17 protein [bacterium]HQP98796.1 glycosyl hydrolase family 17 protein [bacterium]
MIRDIRPFLRIRLPIILVGLLFIASGANPEQVTLTYEESAGLRDVNRHEHALLISGQTPTLALTTTAAFPLDATAAYPGDKYHGVAYGPFRDGQSPVARIFPTRGELQQDIFFLGKLTEQIRTYSSAYSLSEIPRICQEVGLICYPGAYISGSIDENEIEIESLIEVGRQGLSCVRELIVGNEVFCGTAVTEGDLIEYIRRVRKDTGGRVPVGTADTWANWLNHPQLIENVDFVMVHIHPYWDGIAIEDATTHVLARLAEVEAKVRETSLDKPVIIGETGWPSEGNVRDNAIPSEQNQARFLSDFLSIADANNIDYFFFEAFDEKWKSSDAAEAHWGLYYSDGSIKPLLRSFVPEDAKEGIDRREGVFPWGLH